MSDDEELGDYEDYEELGVSEEPMDDEEVGLAEVEPEADEDADEEVGLDEDAAGTDDEDEADDGAGDEEAEPVEPSASQKARPERQKVDPILRMSNKPRLVRVVNPEDRVTDNRLHKTEYAQIIAQRAQQIAEYGTHFTDGGTLHDPVMIAVKELLDRRCPLTLRRLIGTGPSGEQIVEEWAVRTMTLPPLTTPVPLTAGGGRAAPARR